MDSFRPIASSYSSFAFAQAGSFLFQINLETYKLVLADPKLLPELKNLRLGHSLIREALERGFGQDSLRLPDLLEDLALYTNAVHKCSATEQHLRLQSDLIFLKDPRILSRQCHLLEAAREARRHSDKLLYRFDKDASLTTRLSVTSQDVQNWLDVSLGLHELDTRTSHTPRLDLDPNIFWKWTTQKRNLLWCTNASTHSDDESRDDLGLAVARRLLNSRKGFVGYTFFSYASKQLEPIHSLCHLLGQLIASQGMQISTALKGWFLSHKDTRPSLEDARRMLIHELRHRENAYLIFSDTSANKDDLEAFLPIFQDVLHIGRKLFVVCACSMPDQLKAEGWIQITEAEFQEKDTDYDLEPAIEHRRSIGGRLKMGRTDILEPIRQGNPAGWEAIQRWLDEPDHGLSYIVGDGGGEEIRLDTMLRELVSDTTPAAKVSLKMLVWLAFSHGGLTLGELQVAVTDDSNHLAVLGGTNPLERLDYFLRSEQGNDTISIKRNDMGRYLRWWLCNEGGIHTDGPHALISERCLSYISSVFNLTRLPEDDGELDGCIGRYPLLRYAGYNWGKHAHKVESPSDQHTGLIESLLESRLVEVICALMFLKSETSTKRHRRAYGKMTGLHLASAFGLVNVVSRMIGSGNFSPCLRTDDGWTALHWAVEKAHNDVVSLLLTLPDTDSFIDCRTGSEGCTALHFAVKHHQASIVEAMLKTKADVNVQDGQGRTPLYLAIWGVQEEVVEKLLSSGADPNIPSIYGTALHCAVRRGAPSLVRALISASGFRIDLNIKDILALTALEEAQARGRDDVVAVLLEAGAKPSLSLIFTQAYVLGCHQGLSSKESWQAYEVDEELSGHIKQGNQCICHVLKLREQECKHTEEAAAPTRVFRKTFDLASDTQERVQKYLLSEWQILSKLRHPHIVRYIDSDEDPYRHEFLLYMEYCDKGDVEALHGIQLKNLIDKENKRYGFIEDETASEPRPLTGVEVWAMIWQMASALAYLHYGLAIRSEDGTYGASLEGPWAYIIHRDVKPANIVMHGAEKDKFLFKLCDLGIASPAGLGPDQNQTQWIGSSGLQPPLCLARKTIKLTAKLKDELLDSPAFKSFLDEARGIDEDSRPTSLEAMEIAYGNLRTAPGSFANLPRAVLEEMRAVHQVLGRWGGSYLFRSFLLTAELLDSSEPFKRGHSTQYRENLVKRLWLLLDDGAEETFTGKYELPAHLLILIEGRSPKEKLSREQALDKVSRNPANSNHQWVKSGWSALHIAAQEKNLLAVKTLLLYDAEVDLKDKHGMTARHYAKENGCTEMVALLEKAAIEQREERGNTRKRMRLV
ncbi:hypothetical protein BHE90_010888 [Fusarium euwallaceae]|uniref:Protein kinase domain-containing protein n=1 Tax=Fusarium euwallaceae TaxID=1147111 RepID=A0A430LFX7_9HYPO|nr:hypothetical protein BHE90_010888 [Fusarium euwallaceae]